MMDKRLKKRLELAFFAPEPKTKELFLKKLRPREITMTELLFQQVPYIRKVIWIFAFAILTVLVSGAYSMNANTEHIIEALAPLAAVAATLEMYRSCRYQMTEFEMAARFSIRSVLYARMLIIGFVYAAIFCIITPVISIRFGVGGALLAWRILIPYLFTSSLCMRLERTRLGRNNTYISMGAAVILSIVTLWINSNEMSVLTSLITKWGLVITILLGMLTIYENYKTIKMTEGFA
jgi:hypothetical protein